MLRKIFLAVLILLLSVNLLRAKALDIDQYLHSDQELKILVLTSQNREKIPELEQNPDLAKIAVLQVPYAKLKAQEILSLQNWVKGGGTIWFYDSRIGEDFDMVNSPLHADEFKGQDYKGDFGAEGKLPGLITAALARGPHPTLEGVSGVMVYLLKIGDDEYSAVRIEQAVTCLLEVGKPPQAVSALTRYGKGLAVLKPLLFMKDREGDKLMDGERFQANLKEFSAGYEVPAISGMLKEEKNSVLTELDPKKDTVVLKNGKILQGQIKGIRISIETVAGMVDLKPGQIMTIAFSAHNGLDEVTMKNGQKYSGACLLRDELALVTTENKKLSFSQMELKQVIFGEK